MPTKPPDAATLAWVKAVVTRLVAEPWTWKPAPCGCCGEEEIDHIGPIRSGAHDIALDGNVTPDEIVALVNAAPALVAGCEALLAVYAEIAKLPAPFVSNWCGDGVHAHGILCEWCDVTWDEDPWQTIDAKLHPDNGCLWVRALAALDAAREE